MKYISFWLVTKFNGWYNHSIFSNKLVHLYIYIGIIHHSCQCVTRTLSTSYHNNFLLLSASVNMTMNADSVIYIEVWS